MSRGSATLPAMFVLGEWLRGWLFTGFGWLGAGYSQTDSWLMGYAPLGGILAMSSRCSSSAGSIVTFALGTCASAVRRPPLLVAVWLGGLRCERPRAHAAEAGGASTSRSRRATSRRNAKYQPEELPGMMTLYTELAKQSAGRGLRRFGPRPRF